MISASQQDGASQQFCFGRGRGLGTASSSAQQFFQVGISCSVGWGVVPGAGAGGAAARTQRAATAEVQCAHVGANVSSQVQNVLAPAAGVCAARSLC